MLSWVLITVVAASGLAEVDAGTPLVALTPGESRQEFGLVAPLPPATPRASLRLAVLTEGGVHPQGLLGVELGTRVGGERWSALVSSWTMLPTTLTVNDTGSVNVFSFGGMVGVCGQLPLLAGLVVGCATARAGALYTQARHANPSTPEWQPLLSAGLRVSVEWPRDTTFALSLALHGWVPLIRPTVTSDGTSWSQPWVHGGGSIGLVVRPW